MRPTVTQRNPIDDHFGISKTLAQVLKKNIAFVVTKTHDSGFNHVTNMPPEDAPLKSIASNGRI